MKERLNLLRKRLQLSQEEFGSKIGLTKASISRLESGTNNFTEQTIMSICREFNVNKEWFINGTGEMFIDRSPKEQLAYWLGNIVMENDDNFKLRLLNILSELDENEWELLETLALKLAKK
jgi:transcriptional regulator with XRE-family HTH domain